MTVEVLGHLDEPLPDRPVEYRVRIVTPNARVTTTKVLPTVEDVVRYLQAVQLGTGYRHGSMVYIEMRPSLPWEVLMSESVPLNRLPDRARRRLDLLTRRQPPAPEDAAGSP